MKKIILSSDHGGVQLKNDLVEYLKSKNYPYEDLGPMDDSVSVSYAEQGFKLADAILNEKDAVGVGICGTGLGISYALNRKKHIRAARIVSVEDAHLAKQHNNANVIVFGGRQVNKEDAIKMFEEFMNTEFEGGRHIARIEQLDK